MSFRHFHEHLFLETESYIQLCGFKEYLNIAHRIAEMRENNALTKDFQKLFPKLSIKNLDYYSPPAPCPREGKVYFKY